MPQPAETRLTDVTVIVVARQRLRFAPIVAPSHLYRVSDRWPSSTTVPLSQVAVVLSSRIGLSVCTYLQAPLTLPV